MRSYGVISLLALATISSASPISRARRDSSLVPTPPPACVALSSSNSTAVSDGSAVSNVTDATNTTTTCLVSPSDLPSLMDGMNSTDFSNLTSNFNCTNDSTSPSDPTNSTDLSPSDNSDNTDTSNGSGNGNEGDNSGSTDSTSSLPLDASTTTSDSSATDSSAPPDSTSPPPPPPDASTTSSDSSATDSSAPPDSTSPPPPPPPPPASSSQDAGNGGSSGIPDGSTGQFTADTSDPQGRRKKRSLLEKWRPTLRHHRRVSQPDLPDVAQQWQDLCLASGGDIFTNDPCVNLAGVDGINALLSTGGVCDQQDNADNMIDFANSPGITNQADLIAAAIAYRKHPRNADDIGDGVIPSTPYCTNPPRNQELVGIVNDQLPGVNPGLFGGPNFPIVAFGKDGTCPLGQIPDVSTCSCA